MKSNSKVYGVLLAAMVLTTTVLQADDKPAAPTPPAPPAPPAKSATPKLDDLLPDQVIAKGKGFEIKRSRLDEAVSGVRATAMARGRELLPSDLPVIEKTAFDHLLQVQVLKLSATADDTTKATALADKRLAAIKKRAVNEETLTKQLKTMSLTIDDLRARLIEEAVAEQVLRDKVNVTDEQVKKYYTDNPTQFEEPETVTASHILVTTMDKAGTPLSDDEKKVKRKTAEDLLKRARAGEDFTKLAKEYSDDPGVKENDGKYTFHKGQMVPEFEAAAFSLQTNQISDLVTTRFGYHIIKMTEKTPAQKLEFAKVSAEIKNGLEGMEMEKMLPDVYAKLKKDADVQILDDQLKALDESTDIPSGASPKAQIVPAAPK
jgi:parvulin-like peptidyl-prolyl isomerase